ncbi:MAG: dTDP-Rha--alpha-D-GlcNAc-pyrophosphate polyprenol alpha-3-L-rhamnosyltransferase [Actinobacteria bacterium]|nr:MAG: dTDP-Rha--alpha-D-GlcNAc-pyrophosphate polyprenol alpha-3-L-rhamnosyltransferase [Actinomycetota bacterium]
MTAASVSAVVVNYNARDHMLECVRSLRADGVADIVVADNGSSDGSADALQRSDPDVVWLPTGANLGYGGGANRGVARAKGDMLLICNPDVVVEPGAVKALAAALEGDERLAIVGPRIEDRSGTLYPSPRTFPALAVAFGHGFLGLVAPANRFTRRYRMLDWDHGTTGAVDWVSGSCFLVRRTAWEAVGGFDERYFMYVEDVDLCWRASRSGWKVGFEPAARVLHVQGVSTELAPYRMILEHHRSLLRFAWRATTGWQRALLPVVSAGLGVRAVLACGQRALQSRRSTSRDAGAGQWAR